MVAVVLVLVAMLVVVLAVVVVVLVLVLVLVAVKVVVGVLVVVGSGQWTLTGIQEVPPGFFQQQTIKHVGTGRVCWRETTRHGDRTCVLEGASVCSGLCPLGDNDSFSSSLSSLALHQPAEPQTNSPTFVSVWLDTSSLCSLLLISDQRQSGSVNSEAPPINTVLLSPGASGLLHRVSVRVHSSSHCPLLSLHTSLNISSSSVFVLFIVLTTRVIHPLHHSRGPF